MEFESKLNRLLKLCNFKRSRFKAQQLQTVPSVSQQLKVSEHIEKHGNIMKCNASQIKVRRKKQLG